MIQNDKNQGLLEVQITVVPGGASGVKKHRIDGDVGEIHLGMAEAFRTARHGFVDHGANA